MTTFISGQVEMFKDTCVPLHRKRSHGRLKAYASCDDVRAWSNIPGTRQKHLVDIINASRTGYGNYIPILELVKLLGVPTTGVVLAEALRKLNKISEILGESDLQHPILTTSELELGDLCFQQTGRCLEDDALRNLRCLVSHLYERTKDFEQVKCERDELRIKCKDIEDDESQEVLLLKTERNCLQERISAMEGIENRLKGMVKKYENALRENRQLKLDKNQILKEMGDIHKLCAENEALAEEIKKLRRKIRLLEGENRDLYTELTELRCTLGDQDDEISHLTTCIDRLSSDCACQMAQVRYVLNEFQIKINEDLRTKDSDGIGSVPMEEYGEKMTELRDRMRSIIVELSNNADCTEPLFDGDSGVEHSSWESESDPRLRCDYLRDALDATKQRLQDLLDKQDESVRMKEELADNYKKLDDLEEANQELSVYKAESIILQQQVDEQAESLRKSEIANEELGQQLQEKEAEISKLEDAVSLSEQQSIRNKELEDKLMEMEKVSIKAEEAEHLQSQLEETTKKMQAMAEKENAVAAEMKTLRASVIEGAKIAGDCQKLEAELAALKAKLKEAENLIEKQDKDLKESKDIAKTLESQVTGLEGEARKLGTQVEKGDKDTGKMNEILAELDACLSARKKEVDALNKIINDLNSEIDKLSKEGLEKDKKLAACTDELSKLKDQKGVVEAGGQIKQMQLSPEAEKAEAAKAEAAKTEAAKAEAAKTEAAKAEAAKTEAAKAEAAKTEAAKAEAAKTEAAKAEAAKAEAAKAEAAKPEAEKAKGTATAEVDGKKVQAPGMERGLDPNLNAALTEVDNLKKDKAKFDEETAKMQFKMRDALNEKAEMENKLNGCTQENFRLGRELENAKSQIGALDEMNKQLKNQLDECQKALQAKVDDLNNQLANLKKLLASCEAEKEKLGKDLGDCKGLSKAMEEQLASSKKEAEEAKKTLAAVKNELASTKTERDNLKNETEKASNALADINKINEASQKMVQEMKKEKDTLTGQVRRLTVETAQKEAASKGSNEEVEALKKKLNENAKLLEDASKKTADLQKQVLNDVDECDSVKRELEKAKSSLKDADEKIKDLQAKLKNCLSEVAKLEGDNENLKRVIEGNEKVLAALQNELDECGSLKNKLQGQLDESKRALKAAEEEKGNLETAFKKLSGEFGMVKAKADEDARMLDEAKKQAEDLEKEKASMDSQLKNATGDLDKLKAANERAGKIAEEMTQAAKVEAEKQKSNAAACDELEDKLSLSNREKDLLSQALESERARASALEDEKRKILDDLNRCKLENDNLKTKVEALQNANGKLQTKIDELTFDMAQLKKELEQCIALNAKKDKEIGTLKGKIEELASLVKGLQTQLAQCDLELDTAKDKIKVLLTELKSSKEAIDKLTAERDDCVATNRALGKQLEKLENLIQDLGRNNKMLESALGKRGAEVNRLKGNVADLQKKIQGLNITLKDKEKELKIALKTINDLNGQIERLMKEMKRLDIRIEELEKTITQKDNEISGLSDIISDLNYKLEASEIAKQQLEDELAVSLSDIVSLKKQISKLNQNYKELSVMYDDLTLEKNALQLEKDSLEERLEKLKLTLDDLEKILTAEEKKNKNLEDKNNALIKELDALKDEFSNLTKEYFAIRKQLENVEREYRMTLDRLTTSEVANDKLKTEVAVLKEKLEDCTNEIERLRENMRELTSKLGVNNQLLQEYTSTISRLEEENETTRSTLNKTMLELELKMATIGACQKEVEGYKTSFVQLNNELSNVKEAMRNLNDENEDLINEVEFLKKELARFEALLGDCKKQNDEKDWKLLESIRKMNEFEDSMEGYRIAYENTEDLLKIALDEKNKMRKEVDALQLSVNGLEKIRFNLEEDLNNCKNTLKKLGVELEQVRKEYEDLTEVKQEINNELVISRASVASLTDTVKKIKDLLNKTLKDKESVEASLRMCLEANSKIAGEFDDIKRKLLNSEENLVDCEKKLKSETLDKKAKQNIINCLQDELKITKDKFSLCEKELDSLKLERDALLSEIMELKAVVDAYKAAQPEDTPLNNLLMKIIKEGFKACDLTELSELHELVIGATEKLVASGDGKLRDPAAIVKLEPKPRPLTQETKDFVVKLGPLHKQLAVSQQQARKRCCALTESVQRYQHELNALRQWDIEFCKRLRSEDPNKISEDPTLAAVQMRASQYGQSKLAHFIAAGCKKQQEAVCELNQLTQALERVETIQNAAINNKLSDQAVKIAQCLKTKLDEACENEKKLHCLLQQEKQRAACLEYQLCKRLPPQEEEGSYGGSVGRGSRQEVPSAAPPPQRICPPYPSMEGIPGAPTNINGNGNGVQEEQQKCNPCPPGFTIECGGKRRSVSFCNKVDTKYIKPDCF